MAVYLLGKCLAQNVPRDKAKLTLEELLTDLTTLNERLTDRQLIITSDLCRKILDDVYLSAADRP